LRLPVEIDQHIKLADVFNQMPEVGRIAEVGGDEARPAPGGYADVGSPVLYSPVL